MGSEPEKWVKDHVENRQQMVVDIDHDEKYIKV